jgi:uncharacterized membrane protein SpoIIM required for sporulation
VPVRGIVRHGVVVLCGVIAGSRVIELGTAIAESRRVGGTYPAAAQALRTVVMVDAAIVIVSLVIAALVWALLRPPPPAPTERSDRP